MSEQSLYDLCVVLNYYTPHMSGLTELARSVAEGMASRGRRVCVVTSRHDRRLPAREHIGGVDVFRAPTIARIGRGTISPAFPLLAARKMRQSSVSYLHLPMLEAGVITRLTGNAPVVSHHHDDIWLPPGLFNSFQVAAVRRSVRSAISRSAAVVVNNLDHAQNSRDWTLLRSRNIRAITPPCRDRSGGAPAFRETSGLHVGFLGRIAPEKGLTHLVRAFRNVEAPDARLLIAGDHTNVAGGSVISTLKQETADDRRVRFLGFLPDDRIADLYASLDVFALTSIAEESFGIAQAEAMIAGVPAVASDLPGMRFPVQATRFGKLVPACHPPAIAQALVDVGAWTSAQRSTGAQDARERFGLQSCLDAYEELFDEIAKIGSSPK